MQYLGGKSRIANSIAKVINENDCEVFVSLFCGSCAVETKVKASKKILNDKHPYLISMWRSLQNGWEPPDIITKEQYYEIKENIAYSPTLAGFVGFGCSFGGKWFGGYASNKKGDNYCARAKKSVLKDLPGVKDATFTCVDYRQVEIPDGAVVYADPPYYNVTKYTTGEFDHNEFWNYMRELSERCKVYISEQDAPSDFECIWAHQVTRTLDRDKANQPKKIEKLFVWKGINFK